MQKYYKYKYYLNASHSFHDDKEHTHTHTFAITMSIELSEGFFVEFQRVEEQINAYFETYEGKYLNELPAFFYRDPTIENMGEVFYHELTEELGFQEMDLLQLEIMETPLRSYMISNRLLMTSNQQSDNIRRWEDILDKQRYLHALQRPDTGRGNV